VTEAGVDPRLTPLRVGGARPPVFLVAAPGVNALGYVALARRLPPDQPVYIVQPTKRRRSFPAEGIRPDGGDAYPRVAGSYITAIQTVQPGGPYQLVGSCDGGLIAFQMALQLEAQGHAVSLLAVVDTWPLENTSIYPLVLLKLLAKPWLLRTPEQRREVARRKVTKVIERGAGLLRAPPKEAEQPGPALRAAQRWPLWRAKLWPGPGFRPPVVKAPIVVLRVARQPLWRIRDHALGWRGRTTGPVTVHVLSGDHESWCRPPHVEGYGRQLLAYLARPETP
jgi:thioesterase domain-containing protein